VAVKIGVLALQGDFAEHAAMLTRVGAHPCEIRRPEQLEGLHGLIIPGGESTTIGKLMERYGFMAPLRARAHAGFPLWGTCAGLILMATNVGREQPLLGILDITVERNAFGRQIDSFETDVTVDGLIDGPLHAVFIRAPVVRRIAPAVAPIGRLADGTVVAVRSGRLFGTAFHPELTDDPRLHAMFVATAADA